MAETTVIHVNEMDAAQHDIYIGRAVPRRGFTASPWANPFAILKEKFRALVINEFEIWVRESDDPRAVWIREHLEELRGHRLACWCAPNPCHGNVLVKILEEREATNVAR